MPVVEIKSQRTLPRAANNRPKKWWLRGPDGFVELSSLDVEGRGTPREGYRGDAAIRIRGYLPPGDYLLGCGPRGDAGIRQKHTVE